MIASDGFDESIHDVSVVLVRRPDVALLSPADGDALDPSHPVAVSFDVAMDAESVRAGLRLVRLEDGQEVSSRVVMQPTAYTAALLPENRLTSGQAYQLVLSAGVEDVFGNRLEETRRFEFVTSEASEVSVESFFDQLPERADESTESAPEESEEPVSANGRFYIDGEHVTDFELLVCDLEPEDDATPVLHGRELTEHTNPGEVFLRRQVGPEGMIEEIDFRGDFETLLVKRFERAGKWFDELGDPAAPISNRQGGRMTLITEMFHPDAEVTFELKLVADCP